MTISGGTSRSARTCGGRPSVLCRMSRVWSRVGPPGGGPYGGQHHRDPVRVQRRVNRHKSAEADGRAQPSQRGDHRSGDTRSEGQRPAHLLVASQVIDDGQRLPRALAAPDPAGRVDQAVGLRHHVVPLLVGQAGLGAAAHHLDKHRGGHGSHDLRPGGYCEIGDAVGCCFSHHLGELVMVNDVAIPADQHAQPIGERDHRGQVVLMIHRPTVEECEIPRSLRPGLDYHTSDNRRELATSPVTSCLNPRRDAAMTGGPARLNADIGPSPCSARGRRPPEVAGDWRRQPRLSRPPVRPVPARARRCGPTRGRTGAPPTPRSASSASRAQGRRRAGR